MNSSLESKNIDLIFELDNPGLKIEMDTYLIEQVLINLILNAVEACKESENPEIILSAQKNVSGNRLIKVTDNGTGIPDEIIDDIFIPFFTTKKTGSGIGLSLSRQIIRAHKGNLRVNSSPGTGTSFEIIL